MSSLSLRPAQAEVLRYTGGPLAISAVPGAGKTFILTELVARLVGEPTLTVRPHQILVLTYMRGAAATFKRRAAERLGASGLTAYGLTCQTIHAFCLAVVRQARALDGEGDPDGLQLLQELEQGRLLLAALEGYLSDPAALADWGARWGAGQGDKRDPRQLTVEAARKALAAMRNLGLAPDAAARALAAQPELGHLLRAYEAERLARHALDFDALVTEAIAALERDPARLAAYQRRYRFVLEDEAQDSTPAQDRLLRLLTSPAHGGEGNLVRVGDSNQAIMTSFTFNDPRFFRGFCATLAPLGRHVPMQESSRSAPGVLAVANALVVASRAHPDPAVREAFVGGPIELATAGKPNPVGTRQPSWTVYPSKDAEQLGVLTRARAYLLDHPEHRVAVLLFSNNQVVDYEARAALLQLPLYGSELRQAPDGKAVLVVLERTLGFLALSAADPAGAFLGVLQARADALGERWGDRDAVRRHLKGGVDLEALIYPPGLLPPARPGGLQEADYAAVVFCARALKRLLAARHLPPAELLPAIAMELLDDPEAPMLAARAARLVERELASLPRELPPLEALRAAIKALGELTSARQPLLPSPTELAAPRPGELEILTLHRAKGAEYDAVFLPGLGYYYAPREATFFPWRLDQAEIWDQAAFAAEQALRDAAEGVPGDLAERTRAARCLTVAERFRLLYVGVTRAMTELHLSCYHPEGETPRLPHIEAMAHACVEVSR